MEDGFFRKHAKCVTLMNVVLQSSDLEKSRDYSSLGLSLQTQFMSQ